MLGWRGHEAEHSHVLTFELVLVVATYLVWIEDPVRCQHNALHGLD